MFACNSQQRPHAATNATSVGQAGRQLVPRKLGQHKGRPVLLCSVVPARGSGAHNQSTTPVPSCMLQAHTAADASIHANWNLPTCMDALQRRVVRLCSLRGWPPGLAQVQRLPRPAGLAADHEPYLAAAQMQTHSSLSERMHQRCPCMHQQSQNAATVLPSLLSNASRNF